MNIIRWNVDRGPKEKRFVRKPAPLILALLGLSAAHASPPCQGMADKVTKEFDAERTMSNVDRPAKCKALYQVISDLTDLAVACGADRKFIDETYMPLAKSIGEEGPKACQ